MNKKTLGYFLVLIGLILIIYAIFSSYMVFTGKSDFVVFFEAQESISSDGSFLGQEINTIIESHLNDIIPSDWIATTMNLTIGSILYFILIFAGFNISKIGVMLLKD